MFFTLRRGTTEEEEWMWNRTGWNSVTGALTGMVVGSVLSSAEALLAQNGGDPITGGVTGGIIGGAGLLGLVLYWLLFVHLPRKDKQLDEKDALKDAVIERLTERYVTAEKLILLHCEATMTVERAACEENLKAERAASERRYKEIADVLMRDRDAAEKRHAEILAAHHKTYEVGKDSLHLYRGLMQQIYNRTFLADAVQSSDIPTWSKYLDGTITSWNQAAEREFGWTQGEMVSRSVYRSFVPPDRKQQEQVIIQRVFAGESVDEYESERVCKNGQRVSLLITSTPVREQTGKIIGVLSQARYKAQ
jgi:PAS domain S-box-containing protein